MAQSLLRAFRALDGGLTLASSMAAGHSVLQLVWFRGATFFCSQPLSRCL